MKKRKLNLKRLFIALLILIIIVVSVVFALSLNKKKEPNITTPDVIDKVNDYVLYENATNYEKKLFIELKEVLDVEEIAYEEYAKVIGKLFLTSFFTLDNKISKHDVGGVQYVFESYRDDFSKKAQSTVYDGIESNVYGDRKQELPIVSSVTVSDIEKVNFEYNDKVYDDAYELKLIIDYNKDLGYQKDVTLTLIKNNDKLEIAKME